MLQAGGRTAAEQGKSGPLAGRVREKGGLADGELKVTAGHYRNSLPHSISVVEFKHLQIWKLLEMHTVDRQDSMLYV